MFNFFKKTSKIHIDCFTFIDDLSDLFPIIPAAERPPAWFKNVPTTVMYNTIKRGTVRLCPGMNDLYKSGFIIQSWRDIILRVENGLPSWIPNDVAESHQSIQWGDNWKNHVHVKLLPPWKIKEKTGISWLFTNVNYHDLDFRAIVVNGMVEFKYQCATNINMLIPKNIFPGEIFIPAGKELCQIIPMCDKEIKIHMHQVTFEDFEKLTTPSFSFYGQYYKKKKILTRGNND
jgi:hypothetical protein